jgi:hypothetical protein
MFHLMRLMGLVCAQFVNGEISDGLLSVNYVFADLVERVASALCWRDYVAQLHLDSASKIREIAVWIGQITLYELLVGDFKSSYESVKFSDFQNRNLARIEHETPNPTICFETKVSTKYFLNALRGR